MTGPKSKRALSLDSVDVFVRVVRAGSFAEAARRLGMPKSTVSLRVARLERDLGISLLKRTTRSLRLTEAGGAYFEAADRALAELTEAKERLALTEAAPRGMLRISGTIGTGGGTIGDLLTAFLQRYPHVTVDLQLSERRVDLQGGDFDVAFRYGPLDDDSGLIAKRIGVSYRKLFASPDYLARRAAPLRPEDLLEHDVLRYAPGAEIELVDGEGHRIRLRPPGRFLSNQILALRHQAVGGLGIVSLPTGVAAPDVARGALAPVLADWRSDPDPIHMVYAKQRFVPQRVRAFLDFVFDNMPADAFKEA